MKRIEQIAAVLAAIGILMKLLLISGGAMVLGISLSVLATIYYPIGFFYFNSIPINKIFKKESYAGLTFIRGLGTFGGGLIFSILAIGILFKLLQLPGAGAMLTIGLTAGTLFLVVTLIKYFTNRGSSFHKNMVVRTIIIIGLSGILVATPGLTLVKIFYRDNPEYIKAYEQAALNPNDGDLRIKAEEAREKGRLNTSQQSLSVMCQTVSLPASSGLDRSSAPSETLSLFETFVVLAFDFQNAVPCRYRCASGALPLD